jgi:RNA polymerase sigma-70 factor (ECF subfamily)
MRYFDRVYSYLKILLGDRHAAEDAAQEVFVTVLRTLPTYAARGPFRGWLFAIVRNYALSELRKPRRVEPVDPADLIDRADPAAGPEQELSALDWISDRDLMMFVERLPLPQRQVLVLRYMLDLGHKDIARILHRSPDDVRMLQSRAQRFLRERLVAVGRDSADDVRSASMVRRPAHAYLLRRRRFALLR